ncbi:UPF0236 family protein [Lutibacter sp. B2]|nr:UPF0236 family protein [Lutibacter sp. B2]
MKNSVIKEINENIDINSRQKKQYDNVLEKVKELMEKAEDEKIKENLSELYNYYKNNYEALTRYTDREEVNLPKPPDGVQYKGLGTMKGSIRNVLANRMKNNGMSWSINGADHMSKVLYFKHSKAIKKTLKALYNDAKATVNREVKKAIKAMKSKKKHKCRESNMVYAFGKVTRTSNILKKLSSCKLISSLI